MIATKMKPDRLKFSARTSWNTHEAAWARAMTERRHRGLPIFDLTEANPTQCAFQYDPELLNALLDKESFAYAPDAFGLRTARESVCNYYSEHVHSMVGDSKKTEESVTVEQILLTASTSEAYSFVFRLLCDPGDEVLIAQPSYPLFDFLAVLDDVRLVPTLMFYDHGWQLDVNALTAAITPKTRAIVIVHPNNPTGHFTSPADRKVLEEVCGNFGLALIVDEVFLDYSFSGVRPSFVTGEHPVLTFVLSGLSKVAGLPQMKLAWLVVLGPETERIAALARLEVVADTFLSVSTPVQHALPEWLRRRRPIQQQIHARVQQNLQVLDTLISGGKAVDRLEVEGGWYAILRAPALENGEEATLRLLQTTGSAIYPGSFFGMPGERYFVISLLPENRVFTRGAEELIIFLDREQS